MYNNSLLENDYDSKGDSDLRYMKSKLFEISNMIVEDKKMVEILKLANKVSKVNTTVLILGETGVGKEGIAKYIHYNSSRKREPFVIINCGAIPENLIESELFGYEGGAFTGANKSGKIGLFEKANKGTIFLDEIGELPLEVQVKLLRVLQEHKIEKIGSVNTVNIDVRVLAATNRDLNELIEKKLFREDLYYRISVMPINIHPLRERKADIIPLIKHFSNDINKKYNLNRSFSEDALDCLYAYQWKGNIRELRNIVERSIIICDKLLIEKEDLPKYISCISKEREVKFAINNFAIKGFTLKDIVNNMEKEIIDDAIGRYGNVRMAAKALGIDASTLIRKRNKSKNHGTFE